MNIRLTLQSIEEFYRKRPGVGHTTAMIEGARSVPACIVLSGSSTTHQQAMRSILPERCVVKRLSDPLLGLPAVPMVLDNFAIYELCLAARKEIERLENRIAQLEEEPT